MPEGLEAGEILDELDVEVPTAAYETIFPENIGGWSAHKTEHLADKAIENAETEAVKNELVTREDHGEALVKAVQQAREQERRRILNKIEKKIELIEKRSNETGVPEHDLADFSSKSILEELEEEVEGLE